MPQGNPAGYIPDSLLARGVMSGSPIQTEAFLRSERPSEQIGMLEQRRSAAGGLDPSELEVLRMLLAQQNQPRQQQAAPSHQSTRNGGSYNPFSILSDLLGGE